MIQSLDNYVPLDKLRLRDCTTKDGVALQYSIDIDHYNFDGIYYRNLFTFTYSNN